MNGTREENRSKNRLIVNLRISEGDQMKGVLLAGNEYIKRLFVKALTYKPFVDA